MNKKTDDALNRTLITERRYEHMEKKNNQWIIAIALFVVLGIGMISAFGFEKIFIPNNEDLTDEEKSAIQEQRDAILKAIEDNDYATWKSLMQEQLSEDTFNKAVEEQARITDMKTEMENKNLTMHKGKRYARGDFKNQSTEELSDEELAKMQEMQEKRTAYKQAIEDEDYDAWKTLMEQEITDMQSQITQDNFNKIIEQSKQIDNINDMPRGMPNHTPFFKLGFARGEVE
jgi:hypothetical protein